MKKILKAVLLLAVVFLPLRTLADDSSDEPADVARIVSDAKVRKMDQAVRQLSKRINDGVQSHVLTDEKAEELKADVKGIWDKKKEFMESNGAKVLSEDQLSKLKAMWKETSNKIYKAKHP